MPFDIASWATGFALTQAVRAAAKKVLSRGLEKELRSAIGDWADEVVASHLEPAALFPSADAAPDATTSTARATLADTLASERVPSITVWHAALLEQWATRKSAGADQEFFLLDEPQASKQLLPLANTLHSVCRKDSDLKSGETLCLTERLVATTSAQDPVPQLEAAAALLRHGDPTAALAALQKAPPTSPCQPFLQWHEFRGIALIQTGDVHGGITTLSYPATMLPDNIEARLLPAIGHFACGRRDLALAIAEEVATHAPDNVLVQNLRIRTAPEGTAVGQLEGTIPDALTSDASLLLALAIKSAEAGDWDDMVTRAHRAFAQAPDNAECSSVLAAGLIGRFQRDCLPDALSTLR